MRDIRILNDDRQIIEKIQNTAPEALVWGRVHNKANIHGYRADYAQALYEKEARDIEALASKDIYSCRDDMAGIRLDKKAMKTVSENLGHSRIGIIAYNYLYGLSK